MNKYIIFVFLLICQKLFAQEEDKKAGTQAYKEFNEWLNDTIPTITDQYSLTYNHDLERYEELNVRILVNAEVKNGKMTILNSTSRKHNLDYVMNLIKDFHTTLPQNYRLHMEETVLYQPNCYGCPLEEDGYTSASVNYQVTLITDKLFAIYDIYKYVSSAYVYDKRTKQGKMLYHDELESIYK